MAPVRFFGQPVRATWWEYNRMAERVLRSEQDQEVAVQAASETMEEFVAWSGAWPAGRR
ncbi:hypothetical protein [Microtetraspora malaysiensis]|uniref:Uncharacterized protein n=1 Tax=Microtetraspora malaysiensis TaxID=161358 RepID=A0ABW6SLV4_9ACTN